MVTKIDIKDFIKESTNATIIDVRSPGEYEKAHIPGAVNLPLFSNEERADIGTIYKQKSKEKAIIKALDYVGPKMSKIAVEAKNIADQNKLLVHCWRGGMRSNSMAWLFDTVGIDCLVLDGGYKSYRRYIKKELSKKANIIILSGSTGSGKTDVLHVLAQKGEQVIDLEGLSNHKGSAFGGIGQKSQVQTEQFENNLYQEWSVLDHKKPIWIEDESKSIGKIFLPDELFSQMRNAPVIKINIPKDLRVKRLVREYAYTEKETLIYNINRIKKRLGPNEAKLSIEAVENNEMEKAVYICLTFYDKAYAHGLSKRDPETIIELNFNADDPTNIANELIKIKYNDRNS